MKERPRLPGVLACLAKIFGILGGILLAITGIYAGYLYPSPTAFSPSKRSWIDFLLDLLRMGGEEPLGGILAAAAVCLLLAGLILCLISRRLR